MSPTPPTSNAIATAIFHGAIDGYFPETEELAVAELTAQHLPVVLKTLHDAKEAVKEEVRTISRDNEAIVESWMRMTSSLRGDIDATKDKAEEIRKLAEEEKALEEELENAEQHVKFLSSEIKFNDELASILGRLQLIGATLTQADVAIRRGEFEPAVAVLDGADEALARMTGFDDTVVIGLMKEKAKQLRVGLKQRVEGSWSMLMKVDEENASITLASTVELDEVEIESGSVILTLETLGLLESKLEKLHQHLRDILIIPQLNAQDRLPRVEVHGDTIRSIRQESASSPVQIFSNLLIIIKFLGDHLPKKIILLLEKILIPDLTTRLISTPLTSSVPLRLDGIPAFEELLKTAQKFEEDLRKSGWTKERTLGEWVESAPKVWLDKQRELSLDAARKILGQGIGETQTVERSETRTMTADEGQSAMVAGVIEASGADDIDWGDNWGWGVDDDEEPEKPLPEPELLPTSSQTQPPKPPIERKELGGFLEDEEEEDEGANGWGLDDEDLDMDDDHVQENNKPSEPEPAPSSVPEQKASNKDDGNENADEDVDWNAWGGDDDEDDEEHEDIQVPASMATGKPPTENVTAPAVAKREPPQATPGPVTTSKSRRLSTNAKAVTLTETYTVTSIPAQLLSLITHVLEEAETLSSSPNYSSCPIAAAAPGIRALPTQLLAIFRALSPLYYTTFNHCGSMYLYNDCLRLIDQVPHITISNITWTPNPKDLTQLTTFSKRIYSKEMESQRTILLDYLDAAQGFIACSDYPQSTECTTAITSTITHLTELYTSWSTVLSKSALYQSVGSLLNTVVTKLVNDIIDLSDISEPESVALAKYLEQLADALEPLFATPDPSGGEEGKVGEASNSRVVLYCANWLRFRFLEQVLRGSLADITYLWKEGILGQDFEREEVVELVKALFADTDHRRRALEEIKRL